MQKLKQEINHTIAQMQADICEDAHAELQWHLNQLLEMQRNELHALLMEDSWNRGGKGIDSNEKPASATVEPYKSVRIGGDEIKQPLTIEELMVGGWWCADVSEDCRLTFVSIGINAWSEYWVSKTEFKFCYLAEAIVLRTTSASVGLKQQIHRRGNEFYWGAPSC